MTNSGDNWVSGDPYEYFMGRWSKLMAPEFLHWLDIPKGLKWLDLGCGTGALSEAIHKSCNPSGLLSIDPSEGFLIKAKERLSGEGKFIKGSASEIPAPDNSIDVLVSGLALNFFPDLPAAFKEMKRVTKSGGIIAAYVWDYADRMDFLKYFWDAAFQIDPDSHKLSEGLRFSLCNQTKLKETFQQNGLTDIETGILDIETIFISFEDYWNPFLGGQGPAPGYLASLTPGSQEDLKNLLKNNLPKSADGTIVLKGRAFGVRGKNEFT